MLYEQTRGGNPPLALNSPAVALGISPLVFNAFLSFFCKTNELICLFSKICALLPQQGALFTKNVDLFEKKCLVKEKMCPFSSNLCLFWKNYVPFRKIPPLFSCPKTSTDS